MNHQQRMTVLHHEAAHESRAWRWLQEILERHHREFVPTSPSDERIAAISAFVSVMLRLQTMEAAATARECRLRESVMTPRWETSP